MSDDKWKPSPPHAEFRELLALANAKRRDCERKSGETSARASLQTRRRRRRRRLIPRSDGRRR